MRRFFRTRSQQLRAILFIAYCAVFALATALFSILNAQPVALTISPAITPTIAQGIAGLRKAGQTRLVVYGFNIYDAALWTGENFSANTYMRQSFALELRYLRSFKGPAIAEISLKEMRKLGEISDARAAQWLEQMQQTFPDVKKGDALLGMHRPDGSATFLLNGKVIGEVSDADFTRLFFGIWLSPKTSEPKMRGELLGLGASQSAGGVQR